MSCASASAGRTRRASSGQEAASGSPHGPEKPATIQMGRSPLELGDSNPVRWFSGEAALSSPQEKEMSAGGGAMAGRWVSWRWILATERPAATRMRRLAGLAVPIGVIYLAAIVTGLAMNAQYTGDAWNGASTTVPRTEPYDWLLSSAVSMNVLGQGCVCASIAGAMSAVRYAIRNHTHPRVYGIFSFVSYVILLSILLNQVYGGGSHAITALTNRQAVAFADQIYNYLGGNFNWDDDKFATTFADISQSNDFWGFLRGPFHDFLLGNAINQAILIDSQLGLPNPGPKGLVNTPAMASIPMAGSRNNQVTRGTFPWIVSYCNLRQVVRDVETIDVASLLGKRQAIRAPTGDISTELGYYFQATLTLALTLTPITNQASLVQTTNLHARPRPHPQMFLQPEFLPPNMTATVLPSSYTNMFGREVASWDVVGTTGITYPGAGGIVLSDVTYPECFEWNGTVFSLNISEGVHGCMYQGSWFAEWAADGGKFQKIYEREIEELSNSYGIGLSTVMAQLGCSVVNTYEKVQAYTFYTVEFMPSGQVAPMEPKVILANYPYATPTDTFFPLILGFYILCEELQDMIVGGPTRYFLASGWLNLFDWLALLSLCFLLFISARVRVRSSVRARVRARPRVRVESEG
eukprot:TRINITY_DN7000_c0_g1_i8.p1 TRINITY_DN7000_c0_g1~~TRINITY_DN7000_c0_g1_i8.p1  ORF type:complete len:637 (-),score=97.40 TRINITY_DN7000_c0_g1_i8:1304-3214(-)